MEFWIHVEGVKTFGGGREAEGLLNRGEHWRRIEGPGSKAIWKERGWDFRGDRARFDLPLSAMRPDEERSASIG